RNAEVELGAGIAFTPDLQLPPDEFGPFAHSLQTEVSGNAVSAQDLRVDALSVIADANCETPVGVSELNFYAPGPGVSKRWHHWNSRRGREGPRTGPLRVAVPAR